MQWIDYSTEEAALATAIYYDSRIKSGSFGVRGAPREAPMHGTGSSCETLRRDNFFFFFRDRNPPATVCRTGRLQLLMTDLGMDRLPAAVGWDGMGWG